MDYFPTAREMIPDLCAATEKLKRLFRDSLHFAAIESQ